MDNTTRCWGCGCYHRRRDFWFPQCLYDGPTQDTSNNDEELNHDA